MEGMSERKAGSPRRSAADAALANEADALARAARLETQNRQLEEQLYDLQSIVKEQRQEAEASMGGEGDGGSPGGSPRHGNYGSYGGYGGEDDGASSRGRADLERLEGLLEQANVAKSEALLYAKTGKPQLAREVRHLYGLLQQAKADRLAQGRRIVELEGMLARERAAKEEVIEKAASDRAAYREMLKQERGLIARTYEKYQDS